MLVTIETYALKQTWLEQVLRRLSLEHNPVLGIETRVHRRFHVFTMECPFDERPVDIGAHIIRAIHWERLIRPRLDILSYPDILLLERYRFSRKSLIYLKSLCQPYIANTTNRGPGRNSLQTICVALRFLQMVVFSIMLEMLSTSQSFQMTHPCPDQDFHRPPTLQRAILAEYAEKRLQQKV